MSIFNNAHNTWDDKWGSHHFQVVKKTIMAAPIYFQYTMQIIIGFPTSRYDSANILRGYIS